jgi:cell wall-associated NlpC family hydrolase
MRFSRRALAQAAIVTLSLTGAAACTPGQFPTPAASMLTSLGTSADAEPTTGPMTDAIVADSVAALDALGAGDRTALLSSLRPLAVEVGARAGIDPAELERVWTATDSIRMTAVLSALSQVGVRYRYASATPGKAFDCSGLVSWAWSQSGIQLPAQSKKMINGLVKKDISTALPGDVLWYPGHVSLALGVGGSFVHAPYSGSWIEVRASTSRRLVVGSPV